MKAGPIRQLPGINHEAIPLANRLNYTYILSQLRVLFDSITDKAFEWLDKTLDAHKLFIAK